MKTLINTAITLGLLLIPFQAGLHAIERERIFEYGVSRSVRTTPPHALSGDSELNPFLYDRNGNLLRGNDISYEYNQRNRLRRTFKGQKLTSQIVYDGDGNKVGEVLPGSCSPYISPTGCDGGDTLLGIQRYFGAVTHKSDHSQTKREIALDFGIKLNLDDFSREIAVKDHIGSVLNVVSAENISQRRYYPFGATRIGEDSIDTAHREGFHGNDTDSESGTIDFGARHYHPQLGRFVMADTIVPDTYDPQSWNRYSYVRNNPINRVDPTGHADLWSEIKAAPRMWLEGVQMVTDAFANFYLNSGLSPNQDSAQAAAEVFMGWSLTVAGEVAAIPPGGGSVDDAVGAVDEVAGVAGQSVGLVDDGLTGTVKSGSSTATNSMRVGANGRPLPDHVPDYVAGPRGPSAKVPEGAGLPVEVQSGNGIMYPTGGLKPPCISNRGGQSKLIFG